VNPATIDLIIVMLTEGISILGKLSRGEEITEEDLKLETWDETRARVLAEIKAREGGG